ncbi:hypothetical protein Pelo_18983 [Pelomyxa schiedti]|nr:hypothetical protein Pelo_18983 [Pelomyxa schiedti]
MWRLDHSFFPQGEPLRLDVSGMETGKSFSLSLGLTHSQPVDCIADGDELCIVADKDCRCCLWIVDIQRCFNTRALVVTKELNVVREAKWGCDFCLTDILSDAYRRLHVVLTNVRTPGVTTLIQDVATGRLTIHPATVSPVGDTHYGIMYYDQHEPLSHFSVFQTGTDKLVRQWATSSKGEHLWGNGMFFKKEGRSVTCSESLSGDPIASFTVLDVMKINNAESPIPITINKSDNDIVVNPELRGMIEFRGGILARDQAVALLLCRNTQLLSLGEVTTTTKGKGNRPMGKVAVSLLPQCVLHELIQSWVLEPSRCVAIHMESPDPSAQFYPFDAMYVLLSVSHTLGVTGGTPKVLKSYDTPVPIIY